jgi:hypothetical protein
VGEMYSDFEMRGRKIIAAGVFRKPNTFQVTAHPGGPLGCLPFFMLQQTRRL